MEPKKTIVKKNCHSQEFLLGIFRIPGCYAHQAKVLSINNSYVEDPRLKPSGMTPLFNNNAFTLMELLVVVLIIGILAAVAVPQYQKAVLKSRYASLKHLAKSIATAQEIYYLANGQYAEKFEELDIDMPAGKTEESTDRRYVYDWGVCYFTTNQNDALSSCRNIYTSMEYQQRFAHIKASPNVRYCIAYTTNMTDIRSQICQTETGHTEKSVGGTESHSYTGWAY